MTGEISTFCPISHLPVPADIWRIVHQRSSNEKIPAGSKILIQGSQPGF